MIHNLINNLNIALIKKQNNIAIPYTYKLYLFIFHLYSLGYIKRFFLKDKYIHIILFLNTNKITITKIKMCINSQNISSNASNLWPIDNGLHSIIISTPKGLISCTDVKKNNIGGKFLYIIK